MLACVHRVLIIFGTQVTKKKRPVRPVFLDYLYVCYDYGFVYSRWTVEVNSFEQTLKLKNKFDLTEPLEHVLLYHTPFLTFNFQFSTFQMGIYLGAIFRGIIPGSGFLPVGSWVVFFKSFLLGVGFRTIIPNARSDIKLRFPYILN